MKKILVLISIFSCCLMFGQTKEETQSWILKEFNNYKYQNSAINESLEFRDGYLYHETAMSIFRVKIKDIKRIRIEQNKFDSKDNEGWVILSFEFEIGKFEYRDSSSSDFQVSNNDSKINFFLRSNFIDDSMKERLEKASIHLINLYGGEATIVKEPF